MRRYRHDWGRLDNSKLGSSDDPANRTAKQYDMAVNAARWPVQKDDGSISVGIQLATNGPDSVDWVRTIVVTYVDRKTRVDGVNLLEDLWELPRIEVEGSARVQVVFDGRPNKKWKDWLVECTTTLSKSPPDTVFVEGFYDRVAGILRPMSPGDSVF